MPRRRRRPDTGFDTRLDTGLVQEEEERSIDTGNPLNPVTTGPVRFRRSIYIYIYIYIYREREREREINMYVYIHTYIYTHTQIPIL
jgi:hypothetical protein